MPGLFYEGKSLKAATRVVTWHETDLFVVWVGAARMRGGPLEVTTLTLDAKSLCEEEPTERQCRQRLAMIPSPAADSEDELLGLRGTAFRAIPWRDILDSWITLVSETELREEQQGRLGLVVTAPTKRRLGHISSSKRDAILVAYLYAQESALNPRRAASRVADRLGVDVRDVYVALQVARRNDWLTTVKKGRSGGKLTGLGLAACEELEVEARLGDLFDNRK